MGSEQKGVNNAFGPKKKKEVSNITLEELPEQLRKLVASEIDLINSKREAEIY
jgi:hypothetical protein